MDRYTKGFVVASLLYFFVAAALGIWMGIGGAPDWAWFAHVHFNLLGFMAMMIYGVGYFILPRFNGRPLHWPGWLAPHFYLANLALLGLTAAAAGRPSPLFTFFAVLNLVAVALFALNLGATVLIAPGETMTAPLPAAEPEIEITPETRMAEIVSRWPELVEILIRNGFAPLADPAHLEKIKSLPVTLGMACERHGLDVELLASLLTKGARSLARTRSGPAAGAAPQQVIGAIPSGLRPGETITHRHVIGDILKVYPGAAGVFEKYYGSACFSCPGQATESIRQSAMMHNVDEAQVLADLNAVAREAGGAGKDKT
jgi:hypothetical protein